MIVLYVFVFYLQNATVTSQELISRKIKEYNMLRYAGLHIAPCCSAIVLNHLSINFDCMST